MIWTRIHHKDVSVPLKKIDPGGQRQQMINIFLKTILKKKVIFSLSLRWLILKIFLFIFEIFVHKENCWITENTGDYIWTYLVYPVTNLFNTCPYFASFRKFIRFRMENLRQSANNFINCIYKLFRHIFYGLHSRFQRIH